MDALYTAKHTAKTDRKSWRYDLSRYSLNTTFQPCLSDPVLGTVQADVETAGQNMGGCLRVGPIKPIENTWLVTALSGSESYGSDQGSMLGTRS